MTQFVTSSGVPKDLNEEPAHTISFIVFCNGVESGLKVHAYEPCSLTRNSHGATSPDGHNDSSSSSGLPRVTQTPFKFTALRPANCLATACKCRRRHGQRGWRCGSRAGLSSPGPTCRYNTEWTYTVTILETTTTLLA